MTSHNELTARTKNELLAWLRSRGARPGETVEFGWIVLRVCGTPSALDVETAIAFMDDFEGDKPWWKFW